MNVTIILVPVDHDVPLTIISTEQSLLAHLFPILLGVSRVRYISLLQASDKFHLVKIVTAHPDEVKDGELSINDRATTILNMFKRRVVTKLNVYGKCVIVCNDLTGNAEYRDIPDTFIEQLKLTFGKDIKLHKDEIVDLGDSP